MDKDVLSKFLDEYKNELGDKIESKVIKDEFEKFVVSHADKIIPIKEMIAPIYNFIKAIKK